MKQFLTTFFFLAVSILTAQRTISGTFTPAEEFTYLLAYQLRAEGESYIADAPIKEGEFKMTLPEEATKGIYRMVYAIPQDEFYFDVIYSGEEDIELRFDLDEGVSFLNSKENETFLSYFSTINAQEQEIVNFYNTGKNDANEFEEILQRLKDTQETFEKESAQLLAHQFITANRGYMPKGFESKQAYIRNKKDHYFDYLDFQNTTLQASGFLLDKAINYVFTALPSEPVPSTELTTVLKENVDVLAGQLTNLRVDYQFYIFHNLWKQTSANQLNEVSDHLFTNYLKPKAQNVKNLEIVAGIEAQDRLRLGAKAPEIEWVKGTEVHKLSTMDGADHYALVFWSSTCGHCLKELPALHKALGVKKGIKVIAVGLEDDETNWKSESAKLEQFEHVISLGKWESTYAQLYGIQKTPTYFVLDTEKRIVAKPEDDKELIEFLNGK